MDVIAARCVFTVRYAVCSLRWLWISNEHHGPPWRQTHKSKGFPFASARGRLASAQARRCERTMSEKRKRPYISQAGPLRRGSAFDLRPSAERNADRDRRREIAAECSDPDPPPFRSALAQARAVLETGPQRPNAPGG